MQITEKMRTDVIIDEVPDIVLIDVILPVMDGFTVIEKANGNRSIKKETVYLLLFPLWEISQWLNMPVN